MPKCLALELPLSASYVSVPKDMFLSLTQIKHWRPCYSNYKSILKIRDNDTRLMKEGRKVKLREHGREKAEKKHI